MTFAATLRLIRKDLKMGPRSPVFLMVIVVPFLITFLIAGVFGTLFEQTPRLGVTDEGDSAVTEALLARDGIDVTLVEDAEGLRSMVERHDLDAGLLLPEGFDAAATVPLAASTSPIWTGLTSRASMVRCSRSSMSEAAG